jgi:glucokinase
MRGGVDLGGTKIEAVIVAANNDVRGQQRLSTPTEGGPADVAEQILAALRAAADAAGVEPRALVRIGIGSPGDVDETTGEVSGARNLPGWEGSFGLGQHVSDALGPPVFVGNDVNVAVLAEVRLGAARSYGSALGVWWGTGVGGAVVIEGELWSGRGAAGEIGHMVVRRGGARCSCGRRGCMEAYAGRAAMERRARKAHKRGQHTDLFRLMHRHDRDRLTSGVWERALRHGDNLAGKLLDRAVKALGTGIASAVNLLDPEAVILGGGLGDRLGPRYADAIQSEMAKHLFVDQNPPDFRLTELGDLGGAIGASLLGAAAPVQTPPRDAARATT